MGNLSNLVDGPRELAERVKNGQCSIDEIREWVDRILNEWGRAELLQHLKVRFPDENWKAEPTIYKKRVYGRRVHGGGLGGTRESGEASTGIESQD
jgi:hypothetical protein